MLFSLIYTFAFIAINSSGVFAYVGNGVGTISNPYKVATCLQLQDIENDLDGYYAQTGDIDCSDTVNWNSGEGFVPIGQAGDFTGTYDGQNFSITDIFIDRQDSSAVGLFKTTSGAKVKNIHLDGGSMDSSNGGYNGTIASSATNTDFSDCSSTTTLTSVAQAGLVGNMSGGSMTRCSYVGDIDANDNGYTAGLVAVASGADFTDVFTQGTLSGQTYSGSLVGGMDGGTLVNAYSSMDVTSAADTYSGGLTGYMSDQGVGGGNPNLEVTKVFFAGSFTETASNAGVITSFIDNTDFDGVYYDQDNCGCATELGNGTPDSGSVTAVNTDGSDPSYFKGNNTNEPMASWDFDTVWQTNADDFPTLRMGSTPTDSDSDGISNAVEDAGPNSGDANNNGVLDSAESNVAVTTNTVTGDAVILDTECDLIDSVVSEKESAQSAADSGFSYSLGLLDFTVNCNIVGQKATMTQYFFTDSDPDGLVARKVVDGDWQTIDGATITQVTIGGELALKVSYDVTDGGALDDDGSANGVIVDPVGLGTAVTSTETLADTGMYSYLTTTFSLMLIVSGGMIVLKNGLILRL